MNSKIKPHQQKHESRKSIEKTKGLWYHEHEEMYVIYTGDRKSKPFEVSLSEEFFSGEGCCIEVKVKMIYDGKEGDIIN